MARKLKIIVLLLTISLLTVVPAFARLTFAGGATTGSGSLVAEARVAGIGSSGGLVNVTLTLTNNPQAPLVAMCQNKGGKQAPGQNPINVNVYQQQSLTVDSNGSGIAHFHVEYLPTPVAAGCPNANWKVVDLLGYTQVTLTATNVTDGESAQLVLSCYVQEVNKVVDCTQTGSSYTPPSS